MRRAIALAEENVTRASGGPFGAVVAVGEEIVGEGTNRVTGTCDPTAHAEIVAIRAAAQKLGRFSLDSTELFTSCEPCPMCLAAAYWARVDRVWYAAGRDDAAAVGFDDAFLYDELGLPIAGRKLPMRQLLGGAAVDVMRAWLARPDRIPY
jgi:tRNA(Arg) A34 adenosine deaminase TadA